MRRGLKLRSRNCTHVIDSERSEDSPMRRGLKCRSLPGPRSARKAIRRFPDEEGTEMDLWNAGKLPMIFVAIRRFPDEEGTEIEFGFAGVDSRGRTIRRFPDEEGTEILFSTHAWN